MVARWYKLTKRQNGFVFKNQKVTSLATVQR